ncbi:MAG: DUF2075 domain-containing protein [Actinobacteria bacterium]|nr:DUF2075 domain-containing protein [Actinomycetota bacterium]MBU1944812.1 DUF2075 domain-containing protein [Actinomycetota bacterium]MBU2687121.1 DUF2075 domain-containing protein [Actinomycetota bacterium]
MAIDNDARRGWDSGFPEFRDTPPRLVRVRLQDFVKDASGSQVRAWDESIPELQDEVREVLELDRYAREYWAVLEYELPMESRRIDVLLLARGAVVVLELKGKETPSQADIDQASAYARDLRCYHTECANRPVLAVVVPTRAKGYLGERVGVHIAGPDALDALILDIEVNPDVPPLSPRRFLSESSYRPLPTLVQAARELFHTGMIRPIHRARAATDPAVDCISDIIHEAAAGKERRLVLLTGVPGSGKTLVGLRIAHAHFLDDLAVPRENGKAPAPAVYLSGNGPLVEVLQYELREAGGGGKAFVRHVRDYLKRHTRRDDLIPSEHVLIFDEAQRAFDADKVSDTHRNTVGFVAGKSEPEHFIEFAERIPEWSVVIGLIGGGQEIHVGEEAGLVQWRHAIEGCADPENWEVHVPPDAADVFAGSSIRKVVARELSLDTEIRFHLATDLHDFVSDVLEKGSTKNAAETARLLEHQGYHLRITRNLEEAQAYLRERYSEDPAARFGMVASSKDKDLVQFGIPNDFQSTKRVRYGPWYSDPEQSAASCRRLTDVVTEFGAQGLELDSVLLAWGTDFVRTGGAWSNRKARGYQRSSMVKDPFRLRVNAYRVLMTRGRDATVVFVPALEELDETYGFLVTAGFRPIEAES